MNSEIFVYGDEGADPGWLLKSLLALASPADHAIRMVGAWHVVNDPALFSKAAMLIIPGGADKPYCAMLNGRGNANIRRFVEEGGTYLGLCAGAYYGAARIEFNRGQPDEICAPRQLAFFPGAAIGSIPEFGRYYDFTKRSASVPLIQPANGASFGAYYNGGCFFQPDSPLGFAVLARYATLPDQPPAIVRMKIGAGQAILSGVHLEATSDCIGDDLAALSDGATYRHLVTALRASDATRLAFWGGLLKECGIRLS